IVLQGISSAGSVTFSGDYQANLYLNGLGLTAADGAAINNTGGGTLTVTIGDGTANRLIDSAGSGDKAAFYSKGDLAFAGTGVLEVRGKAGHGIASKGTITQTGGTIWVKEAVKDGINAKTVNISGGTFTARTKGDGIQGDDAVAITGGVFEIVTTAEEVKAHGVKSDGDIVIGASGSSSSTPEMEITVYGNGSKCLSSDGDVTIASGSLTLYTAGNGYWDTESDEADKTTACAGIKCDGDLTISGGDITMLSTGTGGKGISVDGDITISGGNLNVTTTGEAYVYGAYDTKSKGIKSDNNITISGGKIVIYTYTDGAEGLECEYTLTISGGDIEIDSYDDAINASGGNNPTTGASLNQGKIIISGGAIFCNSSNNDGIDSNGTIAISGGTVISCGTQSPEEGFDCDNNTFAITGGTLIGLGGATSKPTTSPSTQCSVEFTSASNAAAILHIESIDGKEALTLQLPRTYRGTLCMLFSSPALVSGTQYAIYTDGSISGGTDFHGLYSGAAYTKGTQAGTFTASKYTNAGGGPSTAPGPGNRPGVPGRP
ncbi:MAG: carbohydrate-binding domain-containing protein, partial [Treponema sp.]|nr:carbohydrate-binding domain-containing protein [Treponema sp.]